MCFRHSKPLLKNGSEYVNVAVVWGFACMACCDIVFGGGRIGGNLLKGIDEIGRFDVCFISLMLSIGCGGFMAGLFALFCGISVTGVMLSTGGGGGGAVAEIL